MIDYNWQNLVCNADLEMMADSKHRHRRNAIYDIFAQTEVFSDSYWLCLGNPISLFGYDMQQKKKFRISTFVSLKDMSYQA